MSLAAALIVLSSPSISCVARRRFDRAIRSVPVIIVVRVATTLIVSLPSFEIFRHTRVAAALVVLLSPYKCYTTAVPSGVLICLALPAAPCGVLFFLFRRCVRRSVSALSLTRL